MGRMRRLLCLMLTLVFALPLLLVEPADAAGCESGCPDEHSGVPCIPGCPTCGCCAFAPRAPAPPLLAWCRPLENPWRAELPLYQPGHIPDPPTRTVFHPPRLA